MSFILPVFYPSLKTQCSEPPKLIIFFSNTIAQEKKNTKIIATSLMQGTTDPEMAKEDVVENGYEHTAGKTGFKYGEMYMELI